MSFNVKGIKDNKIVCFVVNAVVCIIWACMFVGTVSYVSTYIFLALLGIVCYELLRRNKVLIIKNTRWYIIFLGMFISFAWTLSDYSIFLESKIGYIKGVVAFFAGWYVLTVLIKGLVTLINSRVSCIDSENHTEDLSGKRRVCFATMAITLAVDLIYLFSVAYPGWVSPDTASQISQMISGVYSNHHPFWHTKLMESVIMPVYKLTGDGDMAFACFSVFQIILISLIFMYFTDTLWEVGVKKKLIWIIIIFQAVAPYNIGMASALVKDTAFSFAVLMLAITAFREISKIENKKKINKVFLLLSVVGSCVLRTNGILAVTMLIIISVIVFRKEKQLRTYLIILLTGWCISVIMNYGYLKLINVEQPDTVEALSISLQQIGRTALEGHVNDSELEYINTIVSYDRLSEVYESFVSDNIKNLIRDEGNQQIIKDDKVQFIKNWITIGLKNPKSYIKGWVDQTRGYWCPSYIYSTWSYGISERVDLSFMNVKDKEKNKICQAIWDSWSGLWEHNRIHPIEIMLAAGLWFWIIVIIGVNAIEKKDKRLIICILPVTLVLSLFIATPVANMFRYVYALFVCLPIILTLAFAKTLKS